MAVSVLLTAHHPQSLTVPARATDQSVASTPRDFLTSPILEEASASDSAGSPNEPATPVSGRNSQELAIENDDSLQYITTGNSTASLRPDSTVTKTLTTATAPSSNQRRPSQATLTDVNSFQPPTDRPLKARQNSTTSLQLKRRLTNMTSNIFHPKRQNSQSEKPQERFSGDSAPPTFKDVSYDLETATVTTTATVPVPTPRKRFSFHKSNGNTRENTPPSPASPLEAEGCPPLATVPTREDFGKRKNRSSTGLSLRGRVINFAHGTHKPVAPRRASSFDSTRTRPVSKKGESGFYPVERDDDILSPVEVGGGAKARRLSISLPDDFQVDVADLLSEFEWEHKFRGRHGRIGKGATSKITTVHRKGFPNEVFIVKEFRSKTSKEKQQDYEQKIKSEFSIAKSLHHPNIVESIRLCTDHGRWNHVMEYCKGGDLFTLVSKNYLNKPEREKDRACLSKQLIQGIAYLHANGIAHRDIKLENLLLTHDSKLKITDFGVSEVFCGLHPGLREAGGQCGTCMGDVRLCEPGICGSGPYMAPEVIHKDKQYDPRGLDIWSAAIVMCHLTFGGALWHLAVSGHAMYAEFLKTWEKWEAKHEAGELISEKTTSLPSFLPFERAFTSFSLRRLIFRMLHPDPKKRITAEEILHSRWMKNTDCCQPESYDEPTKFIDCTKKESLKQGPKIMCHNHLPPVHHGSHSLGKMPGQLGY